ncbi:MAG: hypothetical protein P8Z81_10130 [Deinococcales bacterium]
MRQLVPQDQLDGVWGVEPQRAMDGEHRPEGHVRPGQGQREGVEEVVAGLQAHAHRERLPPEEGGHAGQLGLGRGRDVLGVGGHGGIVVQDLDVRGSYLAGRARPRHEQSERQHNASKTHARSIGGAGRRRRALSGAGAHCA